MERQTNDELNRDVMRVVAQTAFELAMIQAVEMQFIEDSAREDMEIMFHRTLRGIMDGYEEN